MINWTDSKYKTIILQGGTGFIWALESISWPSVILIISLQRRLAHVTMNPTAVTQRGECLARHRNCNLTQYFSHLQGVLKVYICATGCCVSTLLPHNMTACVTVTPCGLLCSLKLGTVVMSQQN